MKLFQLKNENSEKKIYAFNVLVTTVLLQKLDIILFVRSFVK